MPKIKRFFSKDIKPTENSPYPSGLSIFLFVFVFSRESFGLPVILAGQSFRLWSRSPQIWHPITGLLQQQIWHPITGLLQQQIWYPLLDYHNNKLETWFNRKMVIRKFESNEIYLNLKYLTFIWKTCPTNYLRPDQFLFISSFREPFPLLRITAYVNVFNKNIY